MNLPPAPAAPASVNDTAAGVATLDPAGFLATRHCALVAPPEQPFRAQVAGLLETERLLSDGLIRPVIADVFVACDAPDSLQLRALAAALLVPPQRRQQRAWVVGFMSAAWLYTGRWPRPEPETGDGAHRSAAGQPARLDVIIGAGRNRPLDPWIRARQGRLADTEIALLHGLPVSDPVRTAADICRELTAGPALELLRWLGELNQVTPGQVLRQLAAMRYARGAARARVIVSSWQQQGW